jgi:integral membrane protein
MLKTPLGRLRAVGLIEGSSFLLLLLIAMPLKYFAGIAQGVQVVGAIHGVLFILYILAVIQAAVVRKWSMGRMLFMLIASSIPLAPFLLDARLRKEEEEA